MEKQDNATSVPVTTIIVQLIKFVNLLLNRYHGKGRRFWLSTGRDIALVNKTSDFLKDHFLVPPNWLGTQNRGLNRNHVGNWVLPERNDLEEHLPPEDVPNRLRQLGLAYED